MARPDPDCDECEGTGIDFIELDDSEVETVLYPCTYCMPDAKPVKVGAGTSIVPDDYKWKVTDADL
jgi:hypothetical protein